METSDRKYQFICWCKSEVSSHDNSDNADKGLRTLRYIPKKGEHQLSINLGLADAATVFEMARVMGLNPEIVQIPTMKGVEIHALLIFKQEVKESPLMSDSEVSQKLDEWSDRINPDAIRHVYGRFV
jgi:hypothetical protein